MALTAVPALTSPTFRPRRTDFSPAARMQSVADSVDEFGFHIVHVGESCDCADCSADSLPPDQQFGYTIGLTELGQPELLVRGLPARDTGELLNRWGSTVLAGQVFDAGHLLCEGSGGATWELVPVRDPSRELLWAELYYRGAAEVSVSALEVIPARRPCPCHWCS